MEEGRKVGRFDQYLSGKTHISIDGEELDLIITIEDKQKIKTALLNEPGKVSEAKLKAFDDVMLSILYKSYPDENKKALEAYYMMKDMFIMNAVLEYYGFIPKDKKN